MGCHTWVYCYIPEKQDQFKQLIKEEVLYRANSMISLFKDPESIGHLRKGYREFTEDNLYFLDHYRDLSKVSQEELEELIAYHGSLDKLKEEIEESKKFSIFTFEEYIEWCISENQKRIDTINKGILPKHGSFNESEKDIKSYEIIDEKIYVHGIIPHGDDLGRLHDFSLPSFFSADDVINCFKDHGETCDEELIRELFENNDIMIQFG